jgi:hypothetical protein
MWTWTAEAIESAAYLSIRVAYRSDTCEVAEGALIMR